MKIIPPPSPNGEKITAVEHIRNSAKIVLGSNFNPPLLRYLCEYYYFTSFSKLHTDVKTNICQLMSAFWIRNGSNLVFEIKADRFLRNMVRSIVGTMLEIGLRKIHPEDIHQIIQSKNRSNAGTSVPAQGLFLESVKYPYEF